eukprot:1181809-Prorocentrum_minimum.AAC.10
MGVPAVWLLGGTGILWVCHNSIICGRSEARLRVLYNVVSLCHKAPLTCASGDAVLVEESFRGSRIFSLGSLLYAACVLEGLPRGGPEGVQRGSGRGPKGVRRGSGGAPLEPVVTK